MLSRRHPLAPFDWLMLALSTAAALFANGYALAQTCASDGDCPEHFSCVSVGETACPDVKCAPGEKCPSPAACTPTEIKECQSPDCTKDSDCPKDMVCYAQSSSSCTSPACKPNEPCDASTTCTDVTSQRSCVPRYVPPCKADADCGDGFKCMAGMLCSCSGGAGRLPDGGVFTQPDQCSCQPTGESQCELQTLACNEASDCPSGFSCEANLDRGVCSTTGSGSSAGSFGTSSGSAGAASTQPSSPTDAGAADRGCADAGAPAKVCLPPYYDVARKGTNGETSADAGVALGGGTGGSSGHVSQNAGTGGSAASVHHTSGGGCTVAPNAGISAVWSLALGLCTLLGRRRPRALRRAGRG